MSAYWVRAICCLCLILITFNVLGYPVYTLLMVRWHINKHKTEFSGILQKEGVVVSVNWIIKLIFTTSIHSKILSSLWEFIDMGTNIT